MRIPVIRGVIDRRILANYRIDADVARRIIPAPFRPKLVQGYAMGGICLIRLRGVRPKGIPIPVGVSSENGAHRFAVEWDTETGLRSGVYIPRRDTSSSFNVAVGGRLFPGVHHRAAFSVRESDGRYQVGFRAFDGSAEVDIDASVSSEIPTTSVFGTLSAASIFFESGALGYSVTGKAGVYDGLELRTEHWAVTPLEVTRVRSSYFDDADRFPIGTVNFDCALLMRDIAHEWHSRSQIQDTA